jgi:hypothetical protein
MTWKTLTAPFIPHGRACHPWPAVPFYFRSGADAQPYHLISSLVGLNLRLGRSFLSSVGRLACYFAKQAFATKHEPPSAAFFLVGLSLRLGHSRSLLVGRVAPSTAAFFLVGLSLRDGRLPNPDGAERRPFYDEKGCRAP